MDKERKTLVDLRMKTTGQGHTEIARCQRSGQPHSDMGSVWPSMNFSVFYFAV